ncbi:hypothetical protein FD04_GL001681 [Secundilactobacillus odoratitofui DSM 19909 = JCM 15043]|uniref:Uncharacterized protein n=1 Tax=Secundilactobacillus odoratitofui DSM 19909 = JCM 15043 TaxID=1423776 RepID=A0A0R1LP87_9LACO|nr:hypothetical protein [Secundilactobacillus odoratitofui]KRK97645.1 hypothetical protein FD04_GL001681 [Secundilactobacillus odoratitofui DSM 19909 = JCM 15043]
MKQAHKRIFTTVSNRKQAFVAAVEPETMIDYRHEDIDTRVDLSISQVRTGTDLSTGLEQLAANQVVGKLVVTIK